MIVENSQPREWDSLARRIEPYGSSIRRLSFMRISPYNRLVPVPFVLLVLALFLIALIVLLAAARSIDVAEGTHSSRFQSSSGPKAKAKPRARNVVDR
jgi:hypothetical protein